MEFKNFSSEQVDFLLGLSQTELKMGLLELAYNRLKAQMELNEQLTQNKQLGGEEYDKLVDILSQHGLAVKTLDKDLTDREQHMLQLTKSNADNVPCSCIPEIKKRITKKG